MKISGELAEIFSQISVLNVAGRVKSIMMSRFNFLGLALFNSMVFFFWKILLIIFISSIFKQSSVHLLKIPSRVIIRN
jgi:hypothetical protein